MSHLKYGLDRFGSSSTRFLPCAISAMAKLFMAFFFILSEGHAQTEIYFNPRFLADDPASVADLSDFENGQEVPPGTYRVDIYLNDGFITTRDVTFNLGEKGHGLDPCLARSQLAGMGVNIEGIKGIDRPTADTCVPLTKLINGATTHFDVGLQRLYLTVPQAFMGN
ncbi:TPA: FimD/PapC N-terminal domain-containing protein, partial [Klebsiella pneumoniae]|nr:FimD/PapC N-terminal domain-containing protein [Klebsiella pneumoniae]